MSGESRRPFEMIPLHTNTSSTDVGANRSEHVGGGSEVDVSRVTLTFEKFGKNVDGLVLKKIHAAESQTEWAEEMMEEMLKRWRWLKKVNLRREKEGKPTFMLPGTVRGYREGNERGIVMTDLTKGGKNAVYDFKDVGGGYFYPDKNTWGKIRAQIERDIAIAEEEGIFLGGGPYPLDPWLLVLDRERGFTAYLSDIGGYTQVGVSEERAKQSTFYLKRALEEKERDVL